MSSTAAVQYENWLKHWFLKRSEGMVTSLAEEENYFEKGLIDSFGLLELIFSIEKEFKVKLSETHFKDNRFSTIKGLAQIIQELKAAGEKS